MYVKNNDLTLSEEDIEILAERLCGPGFRWEHEMSFMSRANRDAVAKAATQRGAKLRKSSLSNQVVDPRYTTEGQLAGLPDKGMANESVSTNLYKLERYL